MNPAFNNFLTFGQFGNGFQLQQSLLWGQFWTRSQGCCNVYRGFDHINNIDYGRIIATGSSKCTLTLPTTVSHEADTDYYYAVRRASYSGKEEKGTLAVVRLRLDINGKVCPARPNCVSGLCAHAVADGKIQLGWWYWPIGQQIAPSYFTVYGDEGVGAIDYENPLGQVDYAGIRFYSYTSSAGNNNKTYRFSVRAVGSNGSDDGNRLFVEAVVDLSAPDGIEGLTGNVGL